MGTITKCLAKSTLPNDIKQEILDNAKSYREADGFNHQAAAEQAVAEVIEDKLKDRQRIIAHVKSKGGVIGMDDTPPAIRKLAREMSVPLVAEKAAADATEQAKEPQRTQAEQPQVTPSKPSGSPRSSTKTEKSVAQVQDWINDVIMTWRNGNKPKIEVVETFDKLPPAITAVATANDIDGAYYNNTVYLIADAITGKKHALEVLAHEAIGHHSMQQIVGKDWSQIARDVTKLSQSSDPQMRDIAAQVTIRYGDISKELFAKEFLAVAAERKYTEGKLGEIVKKVKRAIQHFLSSIGLTEPLRDSDLNRLIKRAAANLTEENIDPDVINAINEAPPLFSRTPKVRKVSDPHLQSLIEKANPEHPSFWKKKFSWLAEVTNIRQGLFSKFNSLRLLDQEAGVTDEHLSSYIAARMSTSPETQLYVTLVQHPLKWTPKGEVTMDKTIPGLLEILKTVDDKVDLFTSYLAARRAYRLFDEGRELFFTKKEIAAGLELGIKHPEIARAAKLWDKFNSAMLDFAEDAGYINPESRAMWNESDYVPFYRILDESRVGKPAKGRGLQTASIKKLRGSEKATNDILENMILNTHHLISAGMREHALGLARDSMVDLGLARKMGMQATPALVPLSQIKSKMKQNTGPFAEIREWLEKEGVDISTMPTEVLQNVEQMWSITVPKGPDIVQIRRDGKAEFYQVDDPLLMRSLTGINDKALGAWMKVFSVPKRFFTQMTTMTPSFQLRNWLRDTGSAFVLSRDHIKPFFSAITGFSEARKKDDLYWNVMAQGGGFQSGFVSTGDPDATRRSVERALRQHGFRKTMTDYPAKLLDGWAQFSSDIENANRLAVAKGALDEGKSDLMAAFEAKDFMDFSQRGDWQIMNFLSQSVPFLNARLQGLYRLYVGEGISKQDRRHLLIRANPLAFLMHGTILTAAAIGLWWLNHSDDRYKELPDWDKDLNYHAWIGDAHFKIPKGFEVGMIFGSIPERALTAMYDGGDDATKVFLERVGWMALEVFSLNPTPQTLKPLYEVWANKDMFRGRPIEGMSLESLLKPDRYDIWTHDTSKALGKITGQSPAKIDHLVRAYSGAIGDFVMSGTDIIVRGIEGAPEPPDMRIDEYPLIKAIYGATPLKNTAYGKEFYDMYRTMRQAHMSMRRARERQDPERFGDIREEYDEELALYKYMQKRSEHINKINKAIRKVHVRRDISGSAKRAEIDRLLQQKNDLFKVALEHVKRRRGTLEKIDTNKAKVNKRD